ncbi:OmpH family outer membrane protein [Rhodocytophaga rosea]|uniref:OmpH family outer membrane protein n=1 Tax=Rhodocytophaga rosea TaxID=2704465 RepID=A0A6C0GPH6_9BACT|nr:OmpH family outer membrane protein [Rhodocytophaga rosea]QHT69530.1 OmpH family outer membrane protein [Rhodocytophaga rosea]
MKNVSLALNAVLLVAVAVLYYLHFSSRTSASPASSAGKPTSESAVSKNPVAEKIAYVNSDSLLMNYEFYKNTIQQLEERRKKLETEIGGRARSLENEAVSFQQKGNSMTLEQAQLTEKNLYRKQQELVQYRDRLSQQLAQEEQERTEELYNNIANYLKDYTKDKPYKLVLGYTKGGGILFADNSLEITQEVLAGLNNEYKSKQSPAKADSTAKK